MENYDDVKEFFEYLIINDEGWVGLDENAPESALKAYQEYLSKKKDYEEKGLKT